MPPRRAGHGSKPAMPMDEDSRNIPPSTITAQIVEQHTHIRAQNEREGGDAFAQLLNEVRANPMSIEADVQSNYQLVRVVAEAGFDALNKTDPFESIESKTARTIACVDVIEIAVQRTPAAILHAGIEAEGPGSQLGLWLLPKVFAALGRYEYLDLQKSLRRLLTSLLRAVYSHFQQAKDYRKLQQLLQACAEDTLTVLTQSASSGLQSDISLNLPTEHAREIICGQSQQPLVLQQGSQVTIRSSVHAIHVVLALVSSISCVTADVSIGSASADLSPSAPMWTVRVFSNLFREVFTPNTSLPRTVPAETIAAMLKTLHDILSCVSNQVQSCNALRRKSGELLVSCATMVLSSYLPRSSSKFHHQLAKLLELARDFISQSRDTFQEARQHLFPAALVVGEDKALFETLSVELQSAIDGLLRSKETSRRNLTNGMNNKTLSSGSSTGSFSNQNNGNNISETNIDRPSKRQKTKSALDSTECHILLDHLCLLLGDWDRGNLAKLGASAGGFFSDLTDTDKREVLQTLAKIPCSGTMVCEQKPVNTRPSALRNVCECSLSLCRTGQTHLWSSKYWTWFEEILTGLTESTALQSSKEHRILLMKAVSTLVRHTTILQHCDVRESSLGKWCLQSLRSSSRELRLAAGYTLPVFLLADHRNIDISLWRKNRIAALEVLRQLAASEDPRYCETLILALGQIACVCGDEEMNIVLLRLVDYLGNVNSLVCCVAHLELRNIAQMSAMSVEDLVKPFWRSIAITVVKDLLTRPQKTQQLSDLLGISVDQFLALTQSETVPYLVLWKRRDILDRLARLDGNSKGTVWSLCMLPHNLTAILALLVVQDPTDLEKTVLGYLSNASPEFHNEDVANLLKVDPISVACEVLKMAGDAEGEARERAIEGFRGLTVVVERRGHQSKAPSTQARMSEIFFENHALGIMASFSDVIDNPSQARMEKKRCLRAIEQMIIVARSNIRVALPQIRACLQSALEDENLRDEAFVAWMKLLSALESDLDVSPLIDPTFSVLVQNWDNFSAPVQQQAYNAVGSLLQNHGDLIRKGTNLIPSLTSIPLMSKFETQIARFRNGLDTKSRIISFNKRCEDETSAVVLQAVRELVHYLESQQEWIYNAGTTEQAGSDLADLVRVLLDTCVRFKDNNDEILEHCAKCLGIIGSLDPNRTELVREKREIIMLSNFDQAQEAVDFVAFLLENVLVKAFHSVSNPRAQGFLAYVMQELLKFCGFTKDATASYRSTSTNPDIKERWNQMSDFVRSTLQPFLSSRYVLTTHSSKTSDLQDYPFFSPDLSHGTWLRNFTFDLLQRANGDNAQMIFGVLSRIIRGYDVAISGFLLPFAAANVIMGGTDKEAALVGVELCTVLESSPTDSQRAALSHVKSCSENVFQVLDYLTQWLQEKKRTMAASRALAHRAGKTMSEYEEACGMGLIQRVEGILATIPAEIISRRAVECGSYARALFHWEQYIREVTQGASTGVDGGNKELLYDRLQEIYAEIDEPDGVDGILAHLQEPSPEQQILEHKRAGRWAAAQSWYELELNREPQNLELHVNLLDCLQQGGQHHMVLDHAYSLSKPHVEDRRVLSIISKSSWYTERWTDLERFLIGKLQPAAFEFDVGIGRAMLALRNQDPEKFATTVQETRLTLAKTFSDSNTVSLQTCHEPLLKLHALYELEAVSGVTDIPFANTAELQKALTQRLDVVGSYLNDKQYLLGVRRAAMRLSSLDFTDKDIAASWMSSAKLARKENWPNIAYDAVQHASDLRDESAKIEQARLLWKDGEHRKAIQSLQGAIATNAFEAASNGTTSGHASTSTTTATSTRSGKQQEQNLLIAKANLLLAKWLDMAGQTQSNEVNKKYQYACKSYSKWEKGFYHLGKFYNKLFESEKSLAVSKQTTVYLGGETAKLVIENYLRSLVFGCKYLYQTVPKLLTLWLEFGIEVGRSISREVPDDVRAKATQIRPRMLELMNQQVKKYSEKIPAYLFYTALPQMITRMGHPNQDVYDILASIITRVVTAHPQQGLWPLLAVVKSTAHDRSKRGVGILNMLKGKAKNVRNEGQNVDLRELVNSGQRLSDQLLHACEVNIDSRSTTISLKRDLGLNPKTNSPLVVPLERTLSASLPTTSAFAQLRQHKPFPMSRDAITISYFMDDVLILNSLQKPRKLTVMGSDGEKYGLLCKPNDDLRKDQRLMEFNAMINRSLKKDAESSKRRLYIKTYAVTPLNEACGLIEWVDGLKTMRDILINIYRSKGIKVDYGKIRDLLNDACAPGPDSYKIFSEKIIPMYPPVLHEWFTDLFPDPESWFAARLRYTRSCAVSSMVGYSLGLGDRHGENVLLEENSGGVFHVDFNCLFEKGLTFDKPELVPFRLTHNMVDAFGAYGVDGPFRRSAECSMKVMRANEDALLTILETFVYDPTADFVGQRKRTVRGVPETPREVLESVRSKFRGLMKGESVPLSVSGHVDALVQLATDPKNLCAMYIGWCAFF